MSEKRPLLRDVAAASGVSTSTASKVLNGTGRVSEATRARIRAAAERLEFRPNALAKSFATGRSLTIGLLTRDALSTFSMPVVLGANAALGRADMATLMYDSNVDPHGERDHINKLRARSIDGLLVIGTGLGAPVRSVSSALPMPVVYAFGYSESRSDLSLLPDNRLAGRLAGEHLISLGRRRIAHITAKGDLAASERTEGLLEALHAARLELALGAPLEGDWTREWGGAASRRVLERDPDVDAIFCGDDWIALGAQAALVEDGVRIPEDVALVGVDNLGGLVDRPGDSLTTVDLRLAQLGESAATRLLDIITGSPFEPGIVYQECVLVPGRSSNPSLEGRKDDGNPLVLF